MVRMGWAFELAPRAHGLELYASGPGEGLAFEILRIMTPPAAIDFASRRLQLELWGAKLRGLEVSEVTDFRSRSTWSRTSMFQNQKKPRKTSKLFLGSHSCVVGFEGCVSMADKPHKTYLSSGIRLFFDIILNIHKGTNDSSELHGMRRIPDVHERYIRPAYFLSKYRALKAHLHGGFRK